MSDDIINENIELESDRKDSLDDEAGNEELFEMGDSDDLFGIVEAILLYQLNLSHCSFLPNS